MPSDLTKPHDIVDGRNKSSKKTLLDGAIEGHVLLKNTNGALPLKKPQLLSIFGYSAKAPDQNDFAAGDTTAWSFGTESANATDTTGAFGGRRPQAPLGIAPNGTLFSGGGSGATSQTLVSSPFDAISQRAWTDDTQLFWDFHSDDPNVNGASDACLVLVNAWASEGFDRPAIQDDFTDSLVTNVANKCSNTIVVIHNAGTRVVDGWIEHPNVTALIFAHLPGQYSGQALVSILYGESNPSGKLPYTVAKDASDYGGVLDPAAASGIYKYFPQADFVEGVLIDYRHFDAYSIEPRFAFGYGLSYTTFGYGNLSVTTASSSDNSSSDSNSSTLFARYPTGAVRQGGQADLWDELVTVTANVSNTGTVAGAEVAQLYISLPGAGAGRLITNSSSSSSSSEGTPIRQLRGFDKTFLNASSSSTVSFALTRRDLSIWDVDAQKWLLQAGSYTVSVGGSSRSLPLVGSFTIS